MKLQNFKQTRDELQSSMKPRINSKNSLERSLRQELEESEWLKKFKQLSELLTTIKVEIPSTQACKLEWLTEANTLRICCSNESIWNTLIKQQEQLKKWVAPVGNIRLEYREQCEAQVKDLA